MGQRLRAWTAYHMRDGRLNVLIVKPKKQVRCAPQLHQPALRADASGSQFSLFGPVMDTSAQIKQLQVAALSACSAEVILMRAAGRSSAKVVLGGGGQGGAKCTWRVALVSDTSRCTSDLHRRTTRRNLQSALQCRCPSRCQSQRPPLPSYFPVFPAIFVLTLLCRTQACPQCSKLTVTAIRDALVLLIIQP
jgi:hypothetical protein